MLRDMTFILFEDVRNHRDTYCSYNQGCNIRLIVKSNDIHNIDTSNLRDEWIVSKARIQHAAVRAAFDSGSRKSRAYTSCHEQRDEDGTSRSRRASGTRQRDVDEIRADDDARNQEEADA